MRGLADILAAIPVRYGSKRFPGKPLTKILGKPMIQWVVEGVSQSQIIKKIILATDDERIAESCACLPVKVVMTDPKLPSGCDRVFQACEKEPEPFIINIQGDEPLIEGSLLDKMAEAMISAPDNWDMMTFGCEMTSDALESNKTAKIVLDQNQKALYFSRHPIPYSRKAPREDFSGCLKHIGIYGYKRAFLKKFCQTPEVLIEKMEGLEQLRALYLGASIKVLKVNFKNQGVDCPEDVPVVERLLKEKYGQKLQKS